MSGAADHHYESAKERRGVAGIPHGIHLLGSNRFGVTQPTGGRSKSLQP